MLPDPKKVANFIGTLFRSQDERQRERENRRDVQVKMARARMRRFLAQQSEMVTRLTALARRSLALGDEARFRQVGKQLLWTRGQIQRWEKFQLSLDLLEARRDQARASVELIQAVKTMGESLADLAEPGQVGQLQNELEKSLANASTMEERLDVMMNMMDTTLAADMPVDESALESLKEKLGGEVAGEETVAFDHEIEEGLQKIREELRSGKSGER